MVHRKTSDIIESVSVKQTFAAGEQHFAKHVQISEHQVGHKEATSNKGIATRGAGITRGLPRRHKLSGPRHQYGPETVVFCYVCLVFVWQRWTFDIRLAVYRFGDAYEGCGFASSYTNQFERGSKISGFMFIVLMQRS